ncbi:MULTISPECIES: hypothetical protein [unclassified Ruegeria]|uniref:hypothetical protein n=1 Tax=unclassified Ruegeria TaxID=2625375 RepID=UPI001491F6D4|nr:MULTISPECIES: hypothetical protein [unclassified Ruegeria]NOD88366.1 hypothetical protein [Ruegeria sp. HKCCD4318]NOE13275.1 hypothetical protein [Ruegeria sp. HKCCD4318-2]NOG11183.1 hypothetical protein [Ruegeria sp. HKCCD4315]
MNAQDYFLNVVTPLHSAFTENNSIANFYAALTTTYHMVDYIANDLRPDTKVNRRHIEATRDEIIRLCPDFHPIYCVALAQKHAEVTNVHAEPGLKAGDIQKPKATFITVNDKPLIVNGQLLTVTTGFIAMIGGEKVRLEHSLNASVELFASSLDQLAVSVERAFVERNL